MKVPTVKRVQRYASVIVRWLLVGAGVFGLTMATGYYITNDVLPKVYMAKAVLQLPASDLVTPAGSNLGPIALQPEFVNTMMSPELLLAVIKELGLEKAWAQRLHSADDEDLPDVDALTRIGKVVQIQVDRGTNLVEITAASDVPKEAADIANTVAMRYQSLRDLQTDGAALRMLPQSRVHIVDHAEFRRIRRSRTRASISSLLSWLHAC